ncbi:uncharacterized protein A4U43_C09F5530 [Asparagus officinalis]|uniref:Pectinesterase inhibitor domain-containing protein n=1 Tax=Asparagus officinalis TaxID=4686 RepID=A0A5P1E5S6_ASPOF|nr:uncharacterized protein A4U43_C09F5530 [Asparagus officinalis]
MKPTALAFLTLALLLASSPEVAPSALPRPLLEDMMTADSAHTDATSRHACKMLRLSHYSERLQALC